MGAGGQCLLGLATTVDARMETVARRSGAFVGELVTEEHEYRER